MINSKILARKYSSTTYHTRTVFSPRKIQIEPKSVNIDKISTVLHFYCLNLIVNERKTVQFAQIQLALLHCLFRPYKWSQESGVRNQKGPHFYRYRNSIQVIYFRISHIVFTTSKIKRL